MLLLMALLSIASSYWQGYRWLPLPRVQELFEKQANASLSPLHARHYARQIEMHRRMVGGLSFFTDRLRTMLF